MNCSSCALASSKREPSSLTISNRAPSALSVRRHVDVARLEPKARRHTTTLLLQFLPRLKSSRGDILYWRLWDRAFNAAGAGPTGVIKNIQEATNSGIGSMIEALFEWVRQHPEAETPEEFWERLRGACGLASNWGRAARGLAAMHLAWLYAKRPEWTLATLIPSFDWNGPEEAKLVWEGFSFQANVDSALWSLLRKDFLATFENLGELGEESARMLYQLLGRIALHQPHWLTKPEYQRIVTKADHAGREQIAWVFWSNLDAVGDRAASLWRDRIGPWLTACWQPDEALKSDGAADHLIKMALAADDALLKPSTSSSTGCQS